MKKIISVFLLICMLLSLCACGGSLGAVLTEHTNASSAPDSAGMSTAGNQLALIQNNAAIWTADNNEFSEYYYAVTDLDGNGRLEVFAAITQGTGIFTTGRLFEVSEDFTSLVEYPLSPDEGQFIPEVIMASVPCYTSEGVNYYVFSDIVRVDAREQHSFTELLSLSDGKVAIDCAAVLNTFFDENDDQMMSFTDSEGNEITEEMYDNAVKNAFPDASVSDAHFGWFTLDEGELSVLLQNSYDVFRGLIANMPGHDVIPEPVTPPAVIETNPGNIVITKNPTSEALSIGGKTWFIAHAENANAIEWVVTDPQGRSYSLDDAMMLNSGLMLEALDGDTLAVSEIPLSFNGWSVKAVFTSGSFTAVSEPATVYVGDYANIFGDVIQRYRDAYNSGEVLDYGYCAEHGISEWVGYSKSVGYAFKDINKDGVPELFIAGIDSNYDGDTVIYEADALVNGTVVNLCTSYARDRYYLRNDSRILNQGSSGAAYTTFNVLQFNGSALVPDIELSSDLDDNAEAFWHYKENGGNEQILDYDTGLKKAEQLESAVYIPFLTKIA